MKHLSLTALVIALVTFGATPVFAGDTATITIRDGATALGPFIVTLPDASATTTITPNSGTTSPVSLFARSTLATLQTLDATNTDFSLSEIQYFDFGEPYSGGLYLNCVTIPPVSVSPLCADWQYNVNGSAPSISAGSLILNNGDTVFLYFGFPRQAALSASSVALGTPVTATAQLYNPADNTYSPATGVTIGATQPNPNDSFNPLEIATSTVDANGQAIFTLSATGTYNVGIKEDFYFPTTQLTVTDPPPATPAPSGGGGGALAPVTPQFNMASAITYLVSKQNADGSFNSPLLSDWTAVAFAAADPGQAKTALRQYLLTASPPLSSATDYERHAMALAAMGIDPYSGTSINYIGHITGAFDGTQIGDPSLDNDDIFALFPLLHAGYNASDTIIQKEAVFILSKQKTDGSWDESPDMTAAAIQALGPLFSIPGLNRALGKAAGYLASTEQPDGSWGLSGQGNIDSTSWVQTAINGIIEAHTPGFSSEAPWKTSAGLFPTDALASAQQPDGAVQSASSQSDMRVWSTSYAVVAASGKSWVSLLQSFPKPPEPRVSGGGGGALLGTASTATTTAATSTLAIVATSTPEVATTTPVTLIATSTQPSATSTVATIAPHQLVGRKTKLRPIAASSTPSLATSTKLRQNQIALAGQASTANVAEFLTNIWHSFTSFFAHFF